MKLHTLVLPSGQEIRAGQGEWAICSVKVRQSVNRGSSFRLGSVCTAEAEVELFAPGTGEILPGMEVTIWQGEEKLGLFTVQQVRRTGPSRLYLYLEDRGHWLQKELTEWLEARTQWPCTLAELTAAVAKECGFSWEDTELPNGSLTVEKFSQGIVTGEELLGWCAELMGCFCRVDENGALVFGRYADAPLLVSPGGEAFYYQGSLSAGAFPQENVVGVLLRDPENQHFLPVYGQSAHTYTIEGNPLSGQVAWAHLMVTLGGFPQDWTAAVVQVPDSLAVRVGDIIQVFDGERTLRLPVMERLLENGRQTLSSVGSTSHLSSISEAARALAKQLSIAKHAVDAQTQSDIFNKLTDNGNAQGVFLQDGQLYINASFLSAGILDAAVVQVVNLVAQTVCSVLEDSSLEIDGGALTMKSGQAQTVRLSNEAAGLPILYMTDRAEGEAEHQLELSPHHLRLGGTDPVGIFRLGSSEGQATLSLNQGDPRYIDWTWDEALGKYVLTGT